MNIPFPKNKKYLQTNRSNIFGNLWSTQGLDLQSNLGVIRLSPRLQILTKTGDANATDLGCPVGFKYLAGKYYTIAGSKPFISSTTDGINSPFIELTTGSPPSGFSADSSDLEIFRSSVFFTTITKLYEFTGSAWNDRGSLVNTPYPHMLSYFPKFNRLYISSSAEINSLDSSYNLTTTGNDYSLSVNQNNFVTCIKCTTQYVWLGTISTNANSYGSVLQWDGISQQPTEEFKIKARGVMAILIKDNIPYIMDSNGILSEFTGTTFKEVGRIPFTVRPKDYLEGYNTRFIHPNGLVATKNDTILALINNQNLDGSINENIPSGVWEWSKENGFVHKQSLTYNPYGTTTITDWGQNRIYRVGGIAIAEDSASTGLQSIVVGAQYYTNSTDTKYAIFIENTTNTIQKKGYLVTTFYEGKDIEENWTRLWNSYRRFLNSTDNLVFKYRNTEENPLEIGLTWTSTTTFTTTTNITAYSPTSSGFDGVTGGEVEIIDGVGSAGCSHILSVVNNAGTYTVTVDEVYTGATGTATARLQKWIKIGKISSDVGQQKSWEQLAIPTSNENRIQFKCCMTFTGNGEFYNMITNYSTNTKITS